MTKAVKEFLLDHGTGEVDVEYSDNTTTKYNLADAVTATQSAQGVGIQGGALRLGLANSAWQIIAAHRVPIADRVDALHIGIRDRAQIGFRRARMILAENRQRHALHGCAARIARMVRPAAFMGESDGQAGREIALHSDTPFVSDQTTMHR